MHTRRMLAVAAVLAFAPAASAEMKTREFDYKQGDTVLAGLIAWDDAAKGKRPGVLVVHEWWGHNEHARNQAKRLAEAGYVSFALDMYGKGKVATHAKDAEAFMNEATKDRRRSRRGSTRRWSFSSRIPASTRKRSPRSATASGAPWSSAGRALAPTWPQS